MINVSNFQNMTYQQRLNMFKRAIYSFPYFSKLVFPIATGANKEQQYAAKQKVNRDFYLTEIETNFDEVFQDTGSLFEMSVWTGYQESIYRFDIGLKLPTPFISYEARFDTPLANEIFDDYQREFMPKLIKHGDEIYAQISNNTTKGATADALVVIKGWQKDDSVFIDDRTLQKVNESLAKPIKVDFFDFVVDTDGKQFKYLENDIFPRLILGFMCRNSTATKADVSASSIEIKDIGRQKNWNDLPIPLEYFAPRLTCQLKQHIFWLPQPYYFEPRGRLQFELNNDSPNIQQGYQFTALCRTI